MSKSEHSSSLITQVILLTHFGIVSLTFFVLLYVPLFLFFLIHSFLNPIAPQLPSGILIFIKDMISITILLVAAFFLIKKAKTTMQFFVGSLLLITGVHVFMFFQNQLFQQAPFWTKIVLIIYIMLAATSLTLAWKELVVAGSKKATLLIVPGISIFAILGIVFFTGDMAIMKTYIGVGEYLKNLTNWQVNLFYFDFGRFTMLLLGSIYSLITILLLSIPKIPT